MPRALRRAARVAGTTAVVAGTAGAVQHRQNKKYAEKEQAAADKQQSAYDQGVADAQAQQAQAQPAPATDNTDYAAELEKLGELHEKGILTDEEFAAKKQEILSKM